MIVTFDEAGNDASDCCGEPMGPNTPNNGGTTQGNGGGRVGAVLLSPYIKPGSVNETPYNHYSLLRSIEDIFGLPHLGYAAADGLKAFGDDIFTNPAGKSLPPVAKPSVKIRGRSPALRQPPLPRARAGDRQRGRPRGEDRRATGPLLQEGEARVLGQRAARDAGQSPPARAGHRPLRQAGRPLREVQPLRRVAA